MKEVGAELNAVAPVMDQDVIEELEIFVLARCKVRRRTDGGEGIAQRNLRKTLIGGIRGHALQTILRRERIPRIGVALSAGHLQPSKANFVDHAGRKRVRLAGRNS